MMPGLVESAEPDIRRGEVKVRDFHLGGRPRQPGFEILAGGIPSASVRCIGYCLKMIPGGMSHKITGSM